MKRVKNEIGPRIRHRINTLELEVAKALGMFAERVIFNARFLAYKRLKRPGTYLEKFDWYYPGRMRVRVENIHHMAKGISEGTPPHLILPVKGRALRFFKEGVWRFRRMVHHPGTKPTWILRDAWRMSREYLSKLLRRHAGKEGV